MSRRTNAPRRVTESRVHREIEAYDAALSQNITRILNAYHAKHVAPLQDWVSLPWWKRVFRRVVKP